MKAAAMSTPANAAPPMTALLAAFGGGVLSAVGCSAGDAPGPPAGVGEGGEPARPPAGAGDGEVVEADGDGVGEVVGAGDGVAVGGDTAGAGTGVGVAAGEILGAGAGD